MCPRTCFKKGGKMIHSIFCPNLHIFADGTSLPPDWSFLSYEEKIKLKEAHMGRKRRFKTQGSLRTKHLNRFIQSMHANTLDDVRDL